MDFWGPLPSGEHILVVIDEYSCYPEIEFVSSIGAKAVIPHIDKIFATHGFPEQVKTDGGPTSPQLRAKIPNRRFINTCGNTGPPHIAQLEDHLQKCSSDEPTTQGCWNSKSQHMTPSSSIKTLHPKPSKNTIKTTKIMYAHTTSQQVTKCSSCRNQPKATPGMTQTPTQ